MPEGYQFLLSNGRVCARCIEAAFREMLVSEGSSMMVRLRIPIIHRKRSLRRLAILSLAVVVLAFIATTWSVIRPPIERRTSPLLVNDVTQLNPIHVNRVITPTTTAEIVAAVRQSAGPISVGGARHSMGGQIATEGALHIDMRSFDRIIDFSPQQKTITVQAGNPLRPNHGRNHPAHLSR